MKKFILLTSFLIFFSFFASCSSGKNLPRNSNNTIESEQTKQGLSYENPIVIQETNESSGVKAEYAWIRKYYSGSKFVSQALTSHSGKPFDVINITTSEGKDIAIYFDISNFFGKF